MSSTIGQKENGNDADFRYMVHGAVVVVVDLNLGSKSVTNDIEQVIESIDIVVGLRNKILIYRDSMKIYARVRFTDDGKFNGFYNLGLCMDLFDALEQVSSIESKFIQHE